MNSAAKNIVRDGPVSDVVSRRRLSDSCIQVRFLVGHGLILAAPLEQAERCRRFTKLYRWRIPRVKRKADTYKNATRDASQDKSRDSITTGQTTLSSALQTFFVTAYWYILDLAGEHLLQCFSTFLLLICITTTASNCGCEFRSVSANFGLFRRISVCFGGIPGSHSRNPAWKTLTESVEGENLLRRRPGGPVPLKLYCAQKNLFSAYNKNKNLAPLNVFSPKNLKTLLRACCNMDETFYKYFVKACNFRGTQFGKPWACLWLRSFPWNQGFAFVRWLCSPIQVPCW